MIIQKKLLQQYFNVAEFIYLWFVYKIVKFDQSIEKVSSGEVVIIFKSGPLYSVILLFFLAVPFFHILQILLFFFFSILQICVFLLVTWLLLFVTSSSKVPFPV